jgi:hypothetical protein
MRSEKIYEYDLDVTGVTNYVRIRADGRMDLEIRGAFEADNGSRIALSADGVAVPRAAEPVV